ncbi:hypothetical protein N7467_005999 [Penicillium canescens]|nr:hypothetical protein N7467_005999 [Penicillium canescens]
MRLSLFTAMAAMASLGHALAGTLQARDIPTDQLSEFDFWVQYAGAAYYLNDYTAQTGYKISCSKGNCPKVEEAGATIFYDFPTVDDTNKAVVLSFRGSYSVRNWIADASFPYTDPGLCDGCTAELGFWTSWKVVRDDILPQLKDAVPQKPRLRSSSCGAQACKGYPSAKLYAYAAPRVANSALAKYITNQGNNHRFTHINDPLPKLPLLSMGYVHISPEYYITAPNNATVKASDVKVIEGEVSFDGNTGTGLPSIGGFDAHHWYFEEADAGLGAGVPFKRSQV